HAPAITGAGQHADSGLIVGVPSVREYVRRGGATRADRFLIERHRQVVDEYVVLGERKGVHRRWTSALDVDDAAPAPVGAEDGVLDAVLPTEKVGDRVQVPGRWVAQGMRRVTAFERAVEVAWADGVEVVRQFVRVGPALDEDKGATGVFDHIGIGGEIN